MCISKEMAGNYPKEMTGNYPSHPYVGAEVKRPTNQRDENEKILAVLMEIQSFSAKILEMAEDMKDYYLGARPEKSGEDEVINPAPRNGFFDKILSISNETQRNLSEIWEILHKM
jgi:hypothetical protein